MDKVLVGHHSPETAFVIDDYPYGFTLRCKIRYWIETATSGAKKGETRMCSQTSNPKAAGLVWNKPKGGIYHHLCIMVQNGENGHIEPRVMQVYCEPEKYIAFREAYGAQLDPETLKRLDAMERSSRKYNPQSWAEHDKKLAAVSGYVSDAQVD